MPDSPLPHPTQQGVLDEYGNGTIPDGTGGVLQVRGWYVIGQRTPPVNDLDRVTRYLQAAWAAAEPDHGVTLNPSSYTATFVDMARAVLADRARLTDVALTAARLLNKTADMLSHLVMDTPEDQATHDRVVTVHRDAATAITVALAAQDNRGPRPVR